MPQELYSRKNNVSLEGRIQASLILKPQNPNLYDGIYNNLYLNLFPSLRNYWLLKSGDMQWKPINIHLDSLGFFGYRRGKQSCQASFAVWPLSLLNYASSPFLSQVLIPNKHLAPQTQSVSASRKPNLWKHLNKRVYVGDALTCA